MNIPKAIFVLENWYQGRSGDRYLDEFAAMKLGIEALKLVQRERLLGINPVETQLPGETED